jgi:hypothetical protein
MHLRTWVWVTLASAAVVGFDHPAYSWGPHGHRIATRVAEARLSPAARAAIHDLLHPGDTLVGVSNWADHEGHDAEPNSAPWHYVNVPITTSHYDARFCRDGVCVVEKIKHYRKLLADRRAPRAERARALLFLTHFVEDVHQPLHVGDNRDRGGNLTQVQFYNEGDNLHRLWDSSILETISRDDRAWVDRIEPLLSPENVAAWSKGDVEAWADESLMEAKKAYYFPAGASRPMESGTRLGREYVDMAAPIIRLRLAQAGVRLANELNAIFSDSSTR